MFNLPLNPDGFGSNDELAAWINSNVDSDFDFRPIQDVLPRLAPYLHSTFKRALEEALGHDVGEISDLAILIAPRKVRVTFGADSFETDFEDRFESLQEAIVTAAHSLAEQ